MAKINIGAAHDSSRSGRDASEPGSYGRRGHRMRTCLGHR